jgi:predicted O-methyltransferase YrrM
MFFRKKLKPKDLLPPPVQASHGEYSMIFSSHDDPAIATDSLFKISLEAIRMASHVDLTSLANRLKSPPYYPNIWPGEHYKLLAGFALAIKPKYIIEIGTDRGMSALAFKQHLSLEAKIVTFDVRSWKEYPNTLLQEKDFEKNILTQEVADLSSSQELERYRFLLEQADLIFIDATHDGLLEKKFLDNFQKISFQKPPYIILDDIRVWTMLKMWRDVSLPKLDLTSFGHWSGTGIIEWPAQTI